VKHYTKRLAALEPGDAIDALEGVDLQGQKAIVIELEPANKGDTTTVTLFFPDLKAAKRYKVPNSSLSTVQTAPAKYDIPDSVIDQLRSNSPNRVVPTIRDNIPDTFFPPDPAGFESPMTTVLWEPTIRRTPSPRLSNYRRGVGAPGAGIPTSQTTKLTVQKSRLNPKKRVPSPEEGDEPGEFTSWARKLLGIDARTAANDDAPTKTMPTEEELKVEEEEKEEKSKGKRAVSEVVRKFAELIDKE
jgi:hypothetical protein